MHRIVIPACAVQDDHITVNEPRQLRHLLRVLRVTSGDELECFDGAGPGYRGPVVRCSRAEAGDADPAPGRDGNRASQLTRS